AGLRLGATVLEAAPVPGGLCTGYVSDGFTFDYTGHLWHFADPGLQAQVEEWLGEAMLRQQRHAGVWFRGAMVPYPFQLALYQLPEAVAKDIVVGVQRARLADELPLAADFAAAARQRLGDGIVTHFLEPYLGKLLQHDLSAVLAAPMLRFLPLPDHAAILRSYLAPAAFAGYNATYYYPRGGNRRVIHALARRVPGLRTGARVTAIDPQRRMVRVNAAEELAYDRLIVTAPLDRVLAMTSGAPPAAALRAAGIVGLNLGVRGPAPLPQHWVYYPEREYPFYRVGCYSNFAPELAPARCYALYVELPLAWWQAVPAAARQAQVLTALCAAGWLRDAADIVVFSPQVIDPAYVVPTPAGEAQRQDGLAWLRAQGVEMLGRYAMWDYLGMDDVLAAALRLE
ncbi:MAG TPA: FAD-dependent oxidoreductase, partial [bacterium]|nr:FAD-dependent oxidoreductase [bacterium]